MIMVYSDSGRYDEVVEVFECMKNNEVKIDEKTLTLHLMNLRRSGEVELAYDFFRLMVAASELDVVSVYSLTVVVSALCCHGESKRVGGGG
ncbi:unnamed protein product [Eruca vesicaria subsp. sativa]|uniref:Pentatricopeptide repeat-containing protein n=1 Tax=Eruca vesicaria subsp. sativa TaxID=29727 RepID=A0ABC8K2H4_ERUVS|nr:unnamed protein product [Eruca vesicaria subsp. sativa]